MNSSPIGIFDSGSGGLSMLPSFHRMLPQESIVYLGDHLYNPYGGKTSDVIQQRTVAGIQFLVDKNCKLIVIACNTATVAGIDQYRKIFPSIPIVGVVPVIKTATQRTKSKHFIVLSTEYTAGSDYQKKLINDWAAGCIVSSIGSAKLVPLIESGVTETKEIIDELNTILKPVFDPLNDVIVLGCTHYPFIKQAIKKIAGNVLVLDSSEAVSRQVSRILVARNANAQGVPTEQFFTTGDALVVSRVASALLGRQVHITHATL